MKRAIGKFTTKERIVGEESGGLLIAVSFYKNEHLVPTLIRSLVTCVDEFDDLGARVLAINDSPGHEGLRAALVREQEVARANGLVVEILTNPENLGFVGAMNRAFEIAVAERRDIVILNSDTVVFPGAITEMAAVANLDHMVAFVCPRSNNATICSLPADPKYADVTPSEGYRNFADLSRHLPRYTYAPTAVGFCMLIRWRILKEFGGFDTIYGGGYNEENDLCCRAGLVGYRAVIANHAFVWHAGEQSFSISETPKVVREAKNHEILIQRYPHYMGLVQSYCRSARSQAEYLIGGMLPCEDGRVIVAFDFSSFGLHHNGTFEAAKAILWRACVDWSDDFRVAVVCSRAVWDFHELGECLGLERFDLESPTPFAAIIRIGQPFDWNAIDRLVCKAPVIAVSMLDTISMDCGGLFDPQVEEMWAFVAEHVDLVASISDYAMNQFVARFPIGGRVKRLASLLSVDVRDYAPVPPDHSFYPELKGVVFVIGNHYPHKHVEPTLERLLLEMPKQKFLVLGLDYKSDRVYSFKAGNLTDSQVSSLYSSAEFIVFPSFYEGFGLPLMHALAHKKPILARRMPVFEEIISALGGSPNIHLFDTTEEMVSAASSGAIRWVDSDASNEMGWARVAEDLRVALVGAIENFEMGALERRCRAMSVVRAREHGAALLRPLPVPPPLDAVPAGDLRTQSIFDASERAGRVAQKAVARALSVPFIYRFARWGVRVARGALVRGKTDMG